MKNEVKEKKENWWTIFKSLWNNRRYRALIKLSGYFIFLLIVFELMAPGNSTPTSQQQDALTKYSKMDNYEYIYTLTVNQNKQVLRGIKTGDKQVFTIDGNLTRYLCNQENYYSLDENKLVKSPLLFSLSSIEPSKLEEIIRVGTKASTAKYETGEKEEMYTINSNSFYNLYDNSIDNNNTLVNIKVKTLNNEVSMVVIDFTDSKSAVDPSIIKYELKLEYFNIGKIEEI